LDLDDIGSDLSDEFDSEKEIQDVEDLYAKTTRSVQKYVRDTGIPIIDAPVYGDAEAALKYKHEDFGARREPVMKITNELGITEEMTESEYYHKKVLRDAQRLTELPFEMVSERNLAENIMMRTIVSDGTEDDVLAHVEKYFQNRLRSLMLNNEFAKKVKGTDDGHIYLKMLREKCIEELGLNKDVQPYDLQYSELYQDLDKT
jgi:hypothetical protein